MTESDSKEGNDTRPRRVGVKMREMDIDDLAQVYHLGEALFTPDGAPSMYRTWDQYEITGLYQTDSESCLVAETDDGRIAGFALGTVITKPQSAWKYGWLIWLGVDPEWQRHGLAERLFHRFKDVMLKSGVRMLIVDTDAENLPALKLFRKLGFGQPRQHIYLSMNLAADQQRMKKRGNGANGALRGVS